MKRSDDKPPPFPPSRGMTLRELVARVEAFGARAVEAELQRRLQAGRPIDEPAP